MNKRLHIGTSPLTNRIFCGTLLKDGRTWASNKQDITGEALGAVIECVLNNKAPVVVSVNRVPRYEISVRELEGK